MREPPTLSLRSRVTMHELVIRAEADDWIVGRTSTGQFVALPELGVTVIGLLTQDHPLGDVQDRLAGDPDETVEVLEFVEQLAELGFVQAIDGVLVEDALIDDAEQIKPSLPWIRPVHVRWLFSVPMLVGYAGVTLAAIVALVVRPGLLPGYRDLLVSRSPTTVVVADTVITLILMGLHELAHLAAARAVEVPARISWGTRLFDLVAQTSMPGVWAVSARLRMRCYLAGIALDVVLTCLLILAEEFGNLSGLAGHLVRGTAALLVVGIVMQLLVFKRTDFYFVLADLLRARNLHDDACVYLLARGRAALGLARRALRGSRVAVAPVTGLEHLDDREYRLVRYYAWLMLIGSVASTLALVAFIAPAAVTLIARSYSELRMGLSHSDYLKTADASAAIGILIGSWVFFLVVFLRSRGPWWRRIQAGLGPSA
jgi:putative peptide zinc metalloprotease protein